MFIGFIEAMWNISIQFVAIITAQIILLIELTRI